MCQIPCVTRLNQLKILQQDSRKGLIEHTETHYRRAMHVHTICRDCQSVNLSLCTTKPSTWVAENLSTVDSRWRTKTATMAQSLIPLPDNVKMAGAPQEGCLNSIHLSLMGKGVLSCQWELASHRGAARIYEEHSAVTGWALQTSKSISVRTFQVQHSQART